MSQFQPRLTSSRRLRRVMMMSGLALFGIAVAPAGASPIQQHAHMTAAQARAIHAEEVQAQRLHAQQVRASAIHASDFRGWVAYLSAGPEVWMHVHDPKVTLAAREAINQALQLSDPLSSPWIQYLEWRRNLDPARFDHWHPRLGPQLAQLVPPPTTTPITSAQSPPSTPGGQPQGQTITPPPPTTPEPSSLAISLLLIGSGAWWRWRRKS